MKIVIELSLKPAQNTTYNARNIGTKNFMTRNTKKEE